MSLASATGSTSSIRHAAEQRDYLPDPKGVLRDEINALQQQAHQLDESNYAHSRKVRRETVFNMSAGSYDKVRSSRARRMTTDARTGRNTSPQGTTA